MTEKVISLLERESGKVVDSKDFPLGMLGLDSLEFVQLMVSFRSEIADIPDEEWSRINTVGQLIAAAERFAA